MVFFYFFFSCFYGEMHRRSQSFTNISINAAFSGRVKYTNQPQNRLWLYFGDKLSIAPCQQLILFSFPP